MSDLRTIKAGLIDLKETDGLDYDTFHESHREMLSACDNVVISGMLADALHIKRPGVFVDVIDNTIKAIDQQSGVFDKPEAPEKAIVESAKTEAKGIIKEAKDIAKELAASERRILKQINRIGKSCMIMGSELKKAKALLQKQAPFLEWCSSKFGMKKSQSYALIAAYEEFGQNPAMQLLPARVLRIVGGIKEASIKAQVIAEVTHEVNEKGTVSISETEDILTETKILNGQAPKPAKSAPALKKLDSDGSTSELKRSDEIKDRVDKAYKTLTDVHGGTIESDEGESDLIIEKPVPDTMEALKAANAAMKDALHNYEVMIKNLKARKMPWLAQFNNDTGFEKLGIPVGSVLSVAVLAHGRLTEIYTKDSNPKAHDMLNDALSECTPEEKAV